MPQRSGATARPAARRFPPAERVFHLVRADDFEAHAARGGTARTLRKGARTSCCRRPVDEVYAVTVSRDAVEEGPGIRFCQGVK